MVPIVRNEIRFLLNGQEVQVSEAGPSDTLLDYLRLDRMLRGTKEGCAEGDCGACTVLVGRVENGSLRYETVNACIRLIPSVEGCHVVTIEHLRGINGELHPVQQALVDFHASQCGFCTPGIVMSLYALWMQNPSPSEQDVETALQGNLCRCTGYEPIVQAALAAATSGDPEADTLNRERNSVLKALSKITDGSRVVVMKEDETAILPASVDDLADVLLEHPEATIVAGSTDVGLWITKFMRNISPAVFIGHLNDLKSIRIGEEAVTIGAGASYTDSQEVMINTFPHLEEYWSRIGGWQVRNMGTVGGNVANGSPIGDTPPVLIALGAKVTLRRGNVKRTVLLEDFFIEYGKQDREPSDFVESIVVPRLPAGTMAAAYKISKRRDEDISSVCAGITVMLNGGIVSSACLAYGGMAATPKRAKLAESVLIGKVWNEDSVRLAMSALSQDFTPITDWRASADYRARVAENLLYRFFLENSDFTEPVRLTA